MNKIKLVFPLFVLLSLTLGCGLIERFKSSANTNISAPNNAPTVAQTKTPEVAPNASPAESDRISLGRNWLAFGAGAIVVEKTSESADSSNNARHVNDEADFGWQTGDGQIENQSVTLELPARTTLKTIIFDTAQPTYYDGRDAKDVMIEISDESATSGFQTILEATLKDNSNKTGMDDQTFPVTKEIAGRWVRYTAKNNNGSPKAIFTKEIYGYGEQESRAQIPSVSGTYKFDGIGGEVHLKQDGNSIIGCYDENEGLVEGTIDGRVLTLVGNEKGEREKGEKTSFIAANIIDGGSTILSTWWNWSPTPQEKSYDRLHTGTKTSDKIGNCKHLPDLDGTKDVVKDNLEKELAANGKAILYGINFDFNSDIIKPESKPTLEKVTVILNENKDWKMQIEGHTDNVGGETFNQTLSEKRAASVVKYLTENGIEMSRLTSDGAGMSKPVAANNTEAGRAQNRRVELVKQ